MKLKPIPFSLVQIAVLTLAAMWIWFSRVPPELANQSSPSVPYIGFIAPDIQVSTIDGQSVHLSDFHGSPVVINFWATWCRPCRAEMPAFQRIYTDYRDAGVVLLAVNATHLDNLPAVDEFIRQYSLTLPIYLDMNGSAADLFQVRAMPTTYFIAADGKIADIEIGGPLSEATLRIKLEDLLEGQKVP